MLMIWLKLKKKDLVRETIWFVICTVISKEEVLTITVKKGSKCE